MSNHPPLAIMWKTEILTMRRGGIADAGWVSPADFEKGPLEEQ